MSVAPPPTRELGGSIEVRLRRLTRLAGALYLAIFIIYPLATLVRSALVVPGDATATAENIRASEGLFRLGMAGEASIVLIEIALASVLYALFRPVSRAGSLAAALARVSEGVVMAAGNVVTSIVTLVALGGSLAVLPDGQAEALALLSQEANESIVLVWGLFFGLALVVTGWLVHRSGFMPRLPGVLLALAGLGYLAQSFGVLIAPGLAGPLEIVVIVLAIPGELVFALWLLIRGVDTNAWVRRANLRGAHL
ncbi:MAG: DUF4386 domain-containing protein [Actinomycetes bacterium]|nr:DUF4386 domain-containing protein [Actinomycetes bacterium]MDX5380974.1 DUF4386 domain-containing protein [Actinomycetes bacterium]MDX5400110.1 DUF4386 domain-containing protein [Actinomycetes bacterium]MDX5450735.1 DUF4386 domain-containing protein [Actinomycetes bacterium]